MRYRIHAISLEEFSQQMYNLFAAFVNIINIFDIGFTNLLSDTSVDVLVLESIGCQMPKDHYKTLSD